MVAFGEFEVKNDFFFNFFLKKLKDICIPSLDQNIIHKIIIIKK